MIDPKELRIGNHIEVHEEAVEVDWVMISELYARSKGSSSSMFDTTQWKPIPLITKGFLMLDFVNNSSANDGSEWMGGVRKHGDLRCYIHHGKVAMIKYYPTWDTENPEGYWLPISLDYVHQLQNFYYELTRSVLRIKKNSSANQPKG